MNTPQSGLDPVIVDQWRRANGREGALGPHRSRQVRTRGRRGIELYAVLVELEATAPDDFEQLVYWRPLSSIFTFCYLQTPVRTRRTADLVREYPSDFLILAVQSMGSTTGHANGHEFSSRPGQLTITDSRLPYDLTTHGVSDATGIWVPTELLGGAIADGATVPPTAPDTLLTRACAGLVVRFARDVAIGGVDVDPDTEHAAVEVVRAMLGQENSADDGLGDNPLFLREAATDLIDRHFRDPAFDPDAIAKHLHISKRHLYRALEGSDMSLSGMIADRRLDRAHALLSQPGRARLDSIAAAAGFSSAATLRNRFRGRFGMTPDEYRRSANGHAGQDVTSEIR